MAARHSRQRHGHPMARIIGTAIGLLESPPRHMTGICAAILAASIAACPLAPGLASAQPPIGLPATIPATAATVDAADDETAAAGRSTTRASLQQTANQGAWQSGSDTAIAVDQLTAAIPDPGTDATDNTAASQDAGDSPAPLPLAVQDAAETATPAAASQDTAVSTGANANLYPWGQCTWYAYLRRMQLGLPAYNRFGNAANWANAARALGYTVSATPTVGAIVVFAPGQAGAHAWYGHVAIVESIHGNAITISESNVAGLGVISTRQLAADGGWQYIA